MMIHSAWLFGIPIAFVVGLFIGERWAAWSDEEEPMEMDAIDESLDEVYYMIDQHRKGRKG